MDTTDLRHRFGRWRRARPFGGGLLLVLSAAVLFLSANLTLEAMQVHFGPEGFLSYVLPLVLLLCGLLIWFTPAQRVFYAIIALLTAVYSLIGLNLGGFGIGMLLGIAGGALAIAWTPARPAVVTEQSGPAEPAAVTGPAATEPDAVQEPPPFAEPGTEHPGRHHKALGVVAVPLTIGLSLILVGHTPTAARAEPDCPKGMPSRSAPAEPQKSAQPKEKEKEKKAEPAPSKSAEAAPEKDDDDTGNPIVDGWNDFVEGVGDLFGGKDDETPTPAPSGAPSVPSEKPTRPALPKPPGPTAKPADKDEIPCLGPRVLGKKADGGGVPAAAVKGGLMEGDSLTMYDSTYDGVTTLRTASGPKRVLQFSMRKSVTEPFRLTIAEPGGHTTLIETGNLTTTGNVRFYTPRFEGKLFGVIPVTFTPDRPPPLTLPVLRFTDVKIDLSFVRSDELTGTPTLRIREIP